MYGISIYAEFSDEQMKKNFEKAERYKLYIYEDARGYKYAMERENYNKAVAEAEQMAEKLVGKKIRKV